MIKAVGIAGLQLGNRAKGLYLHDRDDILQDVLEAHEGQGIGI